MRSFARFGACLSVVLFLGCLSSGSGGGAPCVDDSECGEGELCGVENKCQAVRCTSRAQCPGTAACLPSGVCGPAECANNGDCGDGGRICREGVCVSMTDLPSCGDGGTCSGGKVCDASSQRCVDCTSTGANRCPQGFTCRSGSCEAQNTSCNNDTPCLTTGRVCDLQNMTCVGCSSTRPCPASHTCNTGSCVARPRCGQGNTCTAPLTCDTASGYCINAGGVALCGACTNDTECMGTGSKCLALAGGTFCGKTCNTTTSPCPSGFTCAPYMGTNQCIPSAGRCTDNCAISGGGTCTGGRTCDSGSGLCMASKSLCDSCSADSECGATTDKCLALGDGGGNRVCAQDCDTTHVTGRNCPSGFTCREISTGVQQCVPQGGECIADPCANVTCDRNSTTPVCNPARRMCVECNTRNDCPASDQECTSDNRCVVPGMCQNDASCTNDPGGTHCCQTALGMKCNECCSDAHCPSTARFCVANRCSSTQDPCAGVNCPTGQACNPQTGNCESTGGGGHINCSAATCPDSGSGTPMECDPISNTCYDPTGLCASDSDCIEGMTCPGGFCMGCLTTGYCPGASAICLPFPGFDICFGG